MRFTQVLVFGLLGTILPVQFANADADGERELLARITHEIEAIKPLISQAVSQANPDARIRFQYDWLRQDLDRIKHGVQDHIDAPRSEPRTFPPLRGDYRR
ncbi:MAG: RAQPRD family integrative conjugative element protein [Gammaproteobacteria bacterium]|nr:RAQPRD family integrative conjugative element protein [Gammaproteobacteria bacterium]